MTTTYYGKTATGAPDLLCHMKSCLRKREETTRNKAEAVTNIKMGVSTLNDSTQPSVAQESRTLPPLHQVPQRDTDVHGREFGKPTISNHANTEGSRVTLKGVHMQATTKQRHHPTPTMLYATKLSVKRTTRMSTSDRTKESNMFPDHGGM